MDTLPLRTKASVVGRLARILICPQGVAGFAAVPKPRLHPLTVRLVFQLAHSGRRTQFRSRDHFLPDFLPRDRALGLFPVHLKVGRLSGTFRIPVRVFPVLPRRANIVCGPQTAAVAEARGWSVPVVSPNMTGILRGSFFILHPKWHFRSLIKYHNCLGVNILN